MALDELEFDIPAIGLLYRSAYRQLLRIFCAVFRLIVRDTVLFPRSACPVVLHGTLQAPPLFFILRHITCITMDEGKEHAAPERKSRHRVKKKATPMSLNEMKTMVKILVKNDYDGRFSNYPRPNTRKDTIMEKVVHVLAKKYGVERTKDQLRKRWSDLKHREEEQLQKIHRMIIKGILYSFRKLLLSLSYACNLSLLLCHVFINAKNILQHACFCDYIILCNNTVLYSRIYSI